MSFIHIFVFSVAFATALAVALYFRQKYANSERATKELRQEWDREKAKYELKLISYDDMTAQSAALERENADLARWRDVSDTEKFCASMRAEAESIVQAAKQEATRTADEAQEKLRTARDDARSIVETATMQARNIKGAAHQEAQKIAGDALAAKENAAQYEQAVVAMKNILKGYGGQYVIPGRSLLDDLAEGFGHTEAGEALRQARERTKFVVKNGFGAECDYVEAFRRTTACDFVLDAFNGKVDSILSRVKTDNAGTLAQEIKDAFSLVNINGKAFRDARISQDLLQARLDELKWAAVVQQIRQDEREEQRRIREQLREEEKARREMERAIREAQREEEALQKALEKLQGQMAQASEEQRLKYEMKIGELSALLRDAEERKRRATALAQVTKCGHVYIISNTGSFGENVYKIGLTRRFEPVDRIRELGDSSVPFDFDIHALIFSENAPALEAHLHRHFALSQVNKVNHRREFFRATISHIREEVAALGVTDVQWTMAAEAREYHETLAIERAIADDSVKREAWLQRQLLLEPEDFEIAEQAEVPA